MTILHAIMPSTATILLFQQLGNKFSFSLFIFILQPADPTEKDSILMDYLNIFWNNLIKLIRFCKVFNLEYRSYIRKPSQKVLIFHTIMLQLVIKNTMCQYLNI